MASADSYSSLDAHAEVAPGAAHVVLAQQGVEARHLVAEAGNHSAQALSNNFYDDTLTLVAELEKIIR